MTRLSNCFLSLALTVGSTSVLADEIEDAVDYRQGIMNVLRYNVKSMGDMVKGKTAFDAADFARYSKDLAAASGLDLLAGFPEDSLNDDSDASDIIWLDWETFQEKYQALQEQAAKLAEVATRGDEAEMKQQFGSAAKTCKGCHDDFKN
ncbi:MAG: cytochrome c [Pseudomonadota bacterium]